MIISDNNNWDIMSTTNPRFFMSQITALTAKFTVLTALFFAANANSVVDLLILDI